MEESATPSEQPLRVQSESGRRLSLRPPCSKLLPFTLGLPPSRNGRQTKSRTGRRTPAHPLIRPTSMHPAWFSEGGWGRAHSKLPMLFEKRFSLLKQRELLLLPRPLLRQISSPCCLPFLTVGTISLTILENLRSDPLDSTFKHRLLQLALPHYDDKPSHRLKPTPDILIPLLIPRHLCSPELRVRLRNRVVPAPLMPVPETAVNEDDSVILRKHNIRLARQSFVIHTVSES